MTRIALGVVLLVLGFSLISLAEGFGGGDLIIAGTGTLLTGIYLLYVGTDKTEKYKGKE